MQELIYLFLTFIIYSVLGWLIEVTLCSIEEKRFVDNLKKKKNENNDNIECKLDGFGSKKYSDVLKINDNCNIQFSLDKESKFVLPYKETYIDYIKKYYFTEGNFKENEKNKTTYFCYKKENINQLNEFGFVINNFWHFFPAENFFKEDDLCEGCGEWKPVVDGYRPRLLTDIIIDAVKDAIRKKQK